MTIIASSDIRIDLGLTLRRYTAFGEDAANLFDGKFFSKAFHAGDGLFLLSLFETADGIALQVTPETDVRAVHAEAARIAAKILGLDAPLEPFYQFARHHPIFALLVEKYAGARPTLSATPFEMLVTSITAQQINLPFAFTVRSRMIRQYGAQLRLGDALYHAFPLPETLAEAKITDLRDLQFSTRKAEYIIGLAQRIVAGELNLARLEQLEDRQIAAALTQLRGIGRWTVDWYLARYLGRGRAIAAGDLGVRKAVEHYFFDGQKQTEAKIRALAEEWGAFANLAVHYLLLDFYTVD